MSAGESTSSSEHMLVQATGDQVANGLAQCALTEPLDPCTIVIFGATGDLTARKLIPALYNLYLNNALPERFAIVGCGRTPLDDGPFRDRLHSALVSGGQTDLSQWESFAAHVYFRALVYDEPSAYADLATFLRGSATGKTLPANRIFYLALPPSLYPTVAQLTGQAGLGAEFENGNGWARLVVEKPFGHDLESAIALDRKIHNHFDEKQIFRIDHYLAKETVQNVLMFRFANAIFEPIWNRRYVDYVSIFATEALGVEKRAGYYEQSGVLRDMFQNHMMQLLALTTMEPPARFEAEQVRDERNKVFRALRPLDVNDWQKHLVLGQYRAGQVNGQQVPAYRGETGIAVDSLTPTYARMKLFVDNWRWQGVPFYLVSGKRLARKVTQIVIQFKAVPHSMFRSVLDDSIVANRLVLGIYPHEKITLTFQTKQPGARVCLRPVTMDFNYDQNQPAGMVLDAYAKVLLDCMLGDQMLFWRQDAVERCWAFLTPILSACETCSDRQRRLQFYNAGSWGPEIETDVGWQSLHP